MTGLTARDRYRHTYSVLRRYISLDEDDEYWEYRDGTAEGNAFASMIMKGDEFAGWTPGSRERRFRHLIYRSTLTGEEREACDALETFIHRLATKIEGVVFGLPEEEE